MANEPNTNPESGEGKKPEREGPSTSKSSAPRTTRRSTTRSTASAAASSTGSSSSSAPKSRKTKAESTIEETFSAFHAGLQQLQSQVTKECQQVIDKVTTDVEKLKNDVASSDPTMSFVRDLTDAVEKRDAAAVAEAFATLVRHTVQRQAAAEKRLLDIVTNYYRGLSTVAENAQNSFLDDARDYSDSVAEALAGSKLSDLRPRDQTVAAHALLLGAIVRSNWQRLH
ncbi:hypothetical protein [Mesorhizobium sp. M0204]|uniref:hypothetical protein n=1 Tax=unclassified Mesorhizobium TaxID=325217 RepID=UPI003338DB4F